MDMWCNFHELSPMQMGIIIIIIILLNCLSH